ncbi:MAG: septation protein A [Planctomycetes bacterium]|jgi:intracellular septation protein|nr:septation protein A [Planctomycetota bacterium]
MTDPSKNPGDNPAEPQDAPPKASPLIRMAIEFGPLVVFFATQRLTRDSDPKGLDGLWYATIAFMLAITLSVIAGRMIERRWPVVPLVTAVFVLLLGGLTLWLQDETFIKIKPTLVNSLFAAILGFGLWRGRIYLKVIFGEAMHLSDERWSRLTKRFIFWFISLAILNEIARQVLNTDDWTTFKTVGLPVLTVLFMLTLGPLISQENEQPEDN